MSNKNVIVEKGNSDVLKSILERYATKFKKKIILHEKIGDRYRTAPRFPIDDDLIHIFPRATTVIEVGLENGWTKIFDISVDGAVAERINMEKEEEKDAKIMGGLVLKDKNGTPFGEVYGLNGFNNLFIHFNISAIRETDEDEKKLFTKILDAYFSFIKSAEAKKLLKEHKEKNKKLLAESEGNYVEACLNRSKAKEKKILKDLKSEEEKIEKLSLQLTEACRSHDSLKEEIKQLQEQDKKLPEEIAKEFQALKANKAVEKIYVKRDKIEVFTKDVIISLEGDIDYPEDKPKKYLIGKFLVTIYYNGDFECQNITHPITGGGHPHGHDDHKEICFGDAGYDITKLIKNYYFAVAFARIWSRLHIYSEGDEIFDIDNWEEVKTGKK